jgi:hypothetical protein
MTGIFSLLVCGASAQESALSPSSSSPEQTSNSQDAPANDPPARVARISYLKGKVSFLSAEQTQWSEATLNYVVTVGDRLYTDKNARAELEVGQAAVRLAGGTDVTITNLTNNVMQLGLEQGTLRVTVYQIPSGDTDEIDTPNGALTLQEPGRYRFEVDKSGKQTLVSVDSGSAEVTAKGISQTVSGGNAVKLTGQNPVQVASTSKPKPDDFDKWSEQRDQRLAESPTAKYVSPSTPGYEELDNNGRWVQVADYGPVWYPTVPVDWVPYRYGHWAWIDPWGWTWIDDAPWGFCPFHYGRWAFVGGVWGWVPGPIIALPVFAPAFVMFLGGPQFSLAVGTGLVAWFPLGPGEPFFPWYHYSTEYLAAINITNVRNVTNITNITNITNVKYAYRNVATTAVPADVFSRGQPVAHHAVRVPPQLLSSAHIIPHPPVNPARSAAMPSRPVKAPPVRPIPRVAATSPATSVRGVPPPAIRRELTTRLTPPPARVPFPQIQHAMLSHPGRPLEPLQFEALRAHRPVGPMLDREFPPHIAPVVPARTTTPHPVGRRPR